jgi:hypothetical protein
MDNIEIIDRESITTEAYRLILETETHHDHEIIVSGGNYYWKKNEIVDAILEKLSLNDIIPLLHSLGYGKNSEIYRKLYRDMGYSLEGYWEIFYWEVNNPIASEYHPNKIG